MQLQLQDGLKRFEIAVDVNFGFNIILKSTPQNTREENVLLLYIHIF